MQKVSEPETFRKNIINSINKCCGDYNKCKYLEIGIYNYTINEAKNRKIVKL